MNKAQFEYLKKRLYNTPFEISMEMQKYRELFLACYGGMNVSIYNPLIAVDAQIKLVRSELERLINLTSELSSEDLEYMLTAKKDEIKK